MTLPGNAPFRNDGHDVARVVEAESKRLRRRRRNLSVAATAAQTPTDDLS